MRLLAMLLTFVIAVGTVGCFKKKKEASEWTRYQTAAESAIESLGNLQSTSLDKTDPVKYRATFEKTKGIVDQFLQASQAEPERASRSEVAAALQDFHLITELVERKRVNAGQYSADKLFASSNIELFSSVK